MTINWLKLWEKEEGKTDGISKDLKALALAVALTANPVNAAPAHQPTGIVEVADTKANNLTQQLDDLRRLYGINTGNLEATYFNLGIPDEEGIARAIKILHKALAVWPEQYFTQKAQTAIDRSELETIRMDLIIFAKAYSECWPVNWRAEIYAGLKAAAAKIKTAQQTAQAE